MQIYKKANNNYFFIIHFQNILVLCDSSEKKPG